MLWQPWKYGQVGAYFPTLLQCNMSHNNVYNTFQAGAHIFIYLYILNKLVNDLPAVTEDIHVYTHDRVLLFSYGLFPQNVVSLTTLLLEQSGCIKKPHLSLAAQKELEPGPVLRVQFASIGSFPLHSTDFTT